MNTFAYFIFYFTYIVLVSSVAADSTIICYFASWSTSRPNLGKFDVSNIDPDLCTHINYAFIGLSAEGTILHNYDTEHFQQLVDLKKNNSELKILVSMGGWGDGSTNYSIVVADPEKRQILVKEVLQFIEDRELDGFDLDWEYPGQRDGSDPDNDPTNFVQLLYDLKAVLSPKGYLLTAAVSGKVEDVDVSYLVPNISEVLDYINIMTYDYRTSNDDQVAHYSPLYGSHLDSTERDKQLNVATGLQYWLDKGANASKVTLGIGAYGRDYILANESDAELYAPSAGPGVAGPYTTAEGSLSYYEICEVCANWTYIWDDEQKVPHKVYENNWIGYDDEESVKLKIGLAISKQLAGAMVWSLDIDDFLGTCGGGTYPIIRTIKEHLTKI